MTLHTQTLTTMFTNNFCACLSFPFTDIRLICSVLVEFLTSFFQVLTCFITLTAAWQQWMPNSDSELDFDGFVFVEFGENDNLAAALGSGNDVD